MEKQDWSFISEWDWYKREDFLFTYNEEEKQQNEINKNNVKLMFKPKYIIFKPQLLELWLTINEALVYWLIDWYLRDCSDRFYFTNEEIWNIFWFWEQNTSLIIKKLKEKWFIETNYKLKSNWWKIRFIKNLYSDYKNFYSPNIKKFIDNNNNINNNNINILLSKDNNSKAENFNETPLLNIDVEEEKEKNSAKKEKEVVYNEYDFVDEFIDKNNWTIQYLIQKDKDYIKKQGQYVDKLIKQWYDIETIKTVLNFIKQDNFWSKNILSIKKLTEKNKDWVPYILVMIEKIKQYRPKCIDLDSLYINN